MAEKTLSSHPPFTPPTTEEDRLSCLRLIRSYRVGPGTYVRLIAEHGSAGAALAALPGIARASGLQDYATFSRAAAEAELAAGRRAGAFPLFLGAPDYPEALAAIADAPPVLWCRGDTGVLTRPAVALVGARNASSLGLRTARALALGLGERGFVVVSGLARGVDTAAHEAALAGGTVAVCAGGVDVIYPAENAELADRIAAAGLIVSEQPPGLVPQARHFPRRNRLISGLARGVVVVEAATRSGSLITARDALEQGREVMAVPGHPFDARAGGCNQLIRDGATLVRGAADVVAALGTRDEGFGRTPSRDAPPDNPPAVASPRPGAETRTPASPGRSTPLPRGCSAPATPTDAAASERRAARAAPPNRSQGAGARPEAPPRAPAGTQPRAPAARAATQAADATAGKAVAAPARAAARPGGDTVICTEAAPAAGSALRRAILDRLGPSPLAEDQLIRDLAVPAARVAPELLLLELDGRVGRQPGGLLARLD